MQSDNDGPLWTLGIWLTKEGQQEAFQQAWVAFARWTAGVVPGAGQAHLLQDPSNQRRFVSFGPWESSEAIQAWRNSDEFGAFQANVKDILESFEPNVLVEVAKIIP